MGVPFLSSFLSLSLSRSSFHSSDAVSVYVPSGDLARPPISTQLSLARILLELDLHSYALEVLRGVREEDDEDVEAAYLEGWAWFLRGEKMEQEGAASGNKGKAPVKAGDAEEADEPTTKQECWEEARESLTMCEIVSGPSRSPVGIWSWNQGGTG